MKPALLQFCGAICSSLFAAAAEAIGAKPISLGIATAPLRACGSPWFGLLVIEAVATIYVVARCGCGCIFALGCPGASRLALAAPALALGSCGYPLSKIFFCHG
jgi:hypothetical protein